MNFETSTFLFGCAAGWGALTLIETLINRFGNGARKPSTRAPSQSVGSLAIDIEANFDASGFDAAQAKLEEIAAVAERINSLTSGIGNSTAMLDDILAQQKRTNELLEALLACEKNRAAAATLTMQR